MNQDTNQKITFDVSILQSNVVGLNQYSVVNPGAAGTSTTLSLVIDGSTYITDASIVS